MKRYFIVDKYDRKVKMVCESNKISFDEDKFELVEKTITEEQEEQLKQNYNFSIKNGIIQSEKPYHIITQEKIEEKENLKKQLQTATTLAQVKTILIQLLS